MTCIAHYFSLLVITKKLSAITDKQEGYWVRYLAYFDSFPSQAISSCILTV